MCNGFPFQHEQEANKHFISLSLLTFYFFVVVRLLSKYIFLFQKSVLMTFRLGKKSSLIQPSQVLPIMFQSLFSQRELKEFFTALICNQCHKLKTIYQVMYLVL